MSPSKSSSQEIRSLTHVKIARNLWTSLRYGRHRYPWTSEATVVVGGRLLTKRALLSTIERLQVVKSVGCGIGSPSKPSSPSTHWRNSSTGLSTGISYIWHLSALSLLSFLLREFDRCTSRRTCTQSIVPPRPISLAVLDCAALDCGLEGA